jgi:hypothetical protein
MQHTSAFRLATVGLLSSLLALPARAAPQRYSLTTLGALSAGFPGSQAYAVNRVGHVTGYAFRATVTSRP